MTDFAAAYVRPASAGHCYANRSKRLDSMPLPQQIPVRYSEEDAGYVSMRPVVKQTFRIHELTDTRCI